MPKMKSKIKIQAIEKVMDKCEMDRKARVVGGFERVIAIIELVYPRECSPRKATN